MNVKRMLEPWLDSKGLLCCLPVEAQPNKEDSCHKAGHVAAILAMLGQRDKVEGVCKLDMYRQGVAVVRHPETIYSTSRDQVIPWLIGYYMNYPYRNLSQIHEWLKRCDVMKDEWRKYEWLIKRFYHTPNGDVFQPDHTAVVLRTRFHVGKWDRVRIMFGDIWMCLDVITKLPQETNRHWVNLVLTMEFARRVRPTIFSEFAHRLFTMFHSKQKVYNEYFSGENNPPIGTLYSKIQEEVL